MAPPAEVALAFAGAAGAKGRYPRAPVLAVPAVASSGLMDSPDRPSRADIPVFEAGARVYTVGDVLAWRAASAGVQGDREGAARVPDAEALIEAFRYRRDLVSAEECEAWLTQRGLEYADLEAAMHRRAHGLGPADADEAMVDQLLDEGFDEAARELSRHAAWLCEQGAPTGAPHPDAATCARWRVDVARGLGQQITDEARRREATRLARAWTRLCGIVVEFDEIAAAREARLCVEHEGEDLEQLAREHGLAWRRFDDRLHALSPAVAALLEALPPGQLGLEPLADGPVRLWRLDSRRQPTPDDPAFAAAIEGTLGQRLLDAQVARHVRWHWPLHHAG